MRIAMLTNNYKPFIGGVPISIERLAKGLRELGHEVFIFAPTYENQVEEESVIRYKTLKHGTSDNKIVLPNIFDSNIEKDFRKLDIDIIHVHHPMLIGNVALRLGKKYNVPVVFTYHTRYEQYLHHIKFYNYLEEKYDKDKDDILSQTEESILTYTKDIFIPNWVRKFSNKCSMVFAPTELIKNYLEDIAIETEIQVMPTGIDRSYFQEDSEKTSAIRNKYKGDKQYLFLTVSRLTKEKNIEFLIDGIKALKNKVGDSFNLMIIGDGPLKETLKNRVRELDLENNVVFLNSIHNEEIGNYYRASDLFLFASKSETQGIVLLEAMAAKNPVVAIKASGVVDVVRNNVNGYMTDEDIDKWSEKIAYLMNNKDEMERLKGEAYTTALKYLNSTIAKTAEINYYKVISDYYKEGHDYEYKISI